MNATVVGYLPFDSGMGGRTYRSTDFEPTDIIYWEQNETDGFYFNDAANNPETAGEGVAQRHYGIGTYTGVSNSSGGGGVLGRLNGAAEFMRMDQFVSFVRSTTPRPNEILNGPGYRHQAQTTVGTPQPQNLS